jgi:hypothetical protein
MWKVASWLAIVFIATLPTASSSQQTADTRAMKPDFSAITSLPAAQRLAAEGKLVKVLVFPAEFGGPDVATNAIYITPEAAQERQIIIGTLRRFASDGTIDKLDVRPEYAGKSFVPSRIVIIATNSRTGGSFNPTIEVW